MVLPLLLDVTANHLALGSADRKRTVAFLPCKITDANLIVHPTGRNGLQLAKHISNAMRRAKADQQMIRDTTDALGNSIRRADDATQVGVQFAAPWWLDHRLEIFRSENDVMDMWCLPSPPPGLGVCFIPHVRWLAPPANFPATLQV